MGRSIILVVDENPSNHNLFQNILRDRCEVICTSSGGTAVEFARTKMASLAFVSNSLPDNSGFELLKVLKPLLPVIITAESPSKELILSSFRNSADDFLEIPFEKNELIKMIQRVTNFSHLNNDFQPSNLFNHQKRKKIGTGIKDFAASFLGNFKTNILSNDIENKIETYSTAQNFEPVSEEESLIIESITMGSSAEKVNISSTKCEMKTYFLGGFRIEVNNQTVNHWSCHKGKEILAYLLYKHKRRIYRDELMAKFWPDSPPECAKNSLNVALHGIRKTFSQICPGRDYILFKDDCYFSNPEIDIWLDVEAFMYHWRVGQSKDRARDIPTMLKEYQFAVNLYKGDFIEEDLYEEWSSLERESLIEIYLAILNRLSFFYLTNSKPLTAITLCERILRKDGCREDIHRRLMKCYYRLGQRDKAIKQFRKCVKILDSELEVGPTQATLGLYEKMKSETFILKDHEKTKLSEN